jgi:hypothetical protein
MKHGPSQHLYGILGLAARAALRFAARRNTPRRHAAWRPIALFWRRQRKGPEGVQASRVAQAAGAVWLPQFHLHFLTRVIDRPRRGSMPGLLPVALIHQRRVVADHQRTIIQSRTGAAQPHHVQRPIRVASLRLARRDLGANVQAAAPHSDSARRFIVSPIVTWAAARAQRPVRVVSLRCARRDSSANVQVPSPYSDSAHRLIISPATTWAAARALHSNPGSTHPSARPGTSSDAQAQTFHTPRIYPRAPQLFRSRSVAIGSAYTPRSQEDVDSPSNFSRPPELVWRAARQSAAGIAANERQLDPRELAHQAQGRSFPGQEAASGMPHPSGHAPASPAMKIDSGQMDRLADDVIRRMEQRARINRERRGL